MDKWAAYEAEKKKLQALKLSPDEYQAAIKALAGRLGI